MTDQKEDVSAAIEEIYAAFAAIFEPLRGVPDTYDNRRIVFDRLAQALGVQREGLTFTYKSIDVQLTVRTPLTLHVTYSETWRSMPDADIKIRRSNAAL